MTDTTHRDGSTRTRGSAGADPDRAARRRGSLDDIRTTYADQADTVARMRPLDRLLVGRYRRRLFDRATGRVLDVACGTGTNAEYVPETAEYVGVDVSPAMLREADTELRRLGRGGTLAEMDAEALAFRDDSFETVISSLSTCTFPDPLAALGEMNRVCEPGGQVLLLEHGRSSVELLGRFQDWRADAHFEKHRCRWNQEPLTLVSRSDLALREASTKLLGVVTAIRAEPG
ncbi:class I SAM-dependent methyltransferase [Halosimplex aquaticum]|uniref:Class I SAM-dependent methyltransferase n=1 Tax=Halosimplex aquaticum TaxID=3026162 RepID=A0ABD5Y649_9EURY|nr:methyltransferase domain-containing protein [Halosimplex aquaticum]